MKFALSIVSKNSKVGPIPVTTSSKETCPPSCPLNSTNNGGCYAEVGPINVHWNKVTSGDRGMDYSELVDAIKALPRGKPFRLNQAGDLAGIGEDIDSAMLLKMVIAGKGKKGFTYTHKYNSEKNLKDIAFANRNGLTVNLSGNNIKHAEELIGKGSPVVCVGDSDYQRRYQKKGDQNWLETIREYKIRMSLKVNRLKGGQAIVICPSTYMDNVTCESCMLCQKSNRSAVVLFPAHGTRAKTANKVATA